MGLVIKLIFLFALGILAIVLFTKFIFSIFNLRDVTNKNLANDVTRQRNGIVFNNKTNKLEADQSIIYPFE